jgi:hypothetical protein
MSENDSIVKGGSSFSIAGGGAKDLAVMNSRGEVLTYLSESTLNLLTNGALSVVDGKLSIDEAKIRESNLVGELVLRHW